MVALLQSVHIHVSTDVGDVMMVMVVRQALAKHGMGLTNGESCELKDFTGIVIDASEAALAPPLPPVQIACLSRDRGMR